MAGLLGRPREAEESQALAELRATLSTLGMRLDAAEQRAAERADDADRHGAARVAEADRRDARTDALEQELRALAARLAQAEERRAAAQAGAATAQARLERLERALDGVLPLLTAALVRRLENEGAGGEAPDVPTALKRLDEQLKAHMADADRTARALVERIEQLRRTPG